MRYPLGRLVLRLCVASLALPASLVVAQGPLDFPKPDQPKKPRFVVENYTSEPLSIGFESATSKQLLSQSVPACSVRWIELPVQKADRYIHLRGTQAEFIFKLADNAEFAYVADDAGFGSVDYHVQGFAGRLEALRRSVAALSQTSAVSAEAEAAAKTLEGESPNPCAMREAIGKLMAKVRTAAPGERDRAWIIWDQMPRSVVDRHLEDRLRSIQQTAARISAGAGSTPAVVAAAQNLAQQADQLLYGYPRPTVADFRKLQSPYQALADALPPPVAPQPAAQQLAAPPPAFPQTAMPGVRPLADEVKDLGESIRKFEPRRFRFDYLRQMWANHLLVSRPPIAMARP